MYDSVSQYGQVVAGEYNDWHPPIMARSWALLRRIAPGTAPFLILQMTLWWGGLGLLAGALARQGRRPAALAVLAVGALPLFLGWATVVLKDAQMAACLVAATGLWAWWRLGRRPLPWPAAAGMALLVGYATLVRGNAAFATIPFALALGGWGGVRRGWARMLLMLAAVAATFAAGGVVNHRLLGAEATHNARTLPIWDIAAIAHRARLGASAGVPAATWAEAERRGCYTPYFWNPYGEPAQCAAVGDAMGMGAETAPRLARDWLALVAAHPLAWAAHRLAHLNATLRFWVGAGEPDAVPPLASEPNPYGLGARPSAGGRALVAAARVQAASPPGWPVVWLAAAAALLRGLRGADGEAARLARALGLSALAMSGSFAVASIASDLRYHLWSMVAAALALAVGAGSLDRRRRPMLAVTIVAVALVASVARFVAAPVYVPLPARVPAPGG